MKKYLTFFLLMTLSGCALWHDFQAPDTALPQSWSAASPADAKGAKAAWPDSGWWTEFRSDALSAMVEEARRSNFDLQAAVARVKQADAQARINGASLLPSVTAGADAGRSRSSRTLRSGALSAVSGRAATSYEASLSASYELDFWGRNYAASQSARELARASRFDQETIAITVAASVANTYFDILATRDRLAVARENLANAEKLLSSIRNRFTQGVGTALDVAQQESVVATQRSAIPPLEQRLQQSMNAQALLLGKMPEGFAVSDMKLAGVAVPQVPEGIPSELLQRRPDVQAAEAQLASAHADIIAARARMFPSITLTGSGGYESAALANLFRPDSILWSAVGSLTQPIFEGGALMGELEFRKARYEELLQNYRKSVVSAFTDVEDALTAVKQTDAEEKAQMHARDTARRAYQLSQRQMEGGIVDITTVLDVQRTLFAAEDALVQARLTHLQAVVSLYRALGGGWISGQPQAKAAGGAAASDAKEDGKAGSANTLATSGARPYRAH